MLFKIHFYSMKICKKTYNKFNLINKVYKIFKKSMKITVKTLKGEMIEIEVEPATTVTLFLLLDSSNQIKS